MFIFGTNDFGKKKCRNDGTTCRCYCELDTGAGKCVKRKNHKGSKLYAFKAACKFLNILPYIFGTFKDFVPA